MERSETAEARMVPWELLEYVGEALVFIGVVGEVFAGWREPEHKGLERLSSLVLIIGLALSLASLKGTNARFNFTIATLNKEASDADERAARASLDAAQLRLRADQLEGQILEQGPRDLLLYGKREENFTNAIRKFNGQKVQVRICVVTDNEARDAAQRLTFLFKKAGWVVSYGSPNWEESNCMMVRPNQPIPIGIWVGTPSPHPAARTRDRAKELVRLLDRVPLVATLHHVEIETGQSSATRESIDEHYGDSDSIVVTVLGHPSESTFRDSTTVSPILGMP